MKKNNNQVPKPRKQSEYVRQILDTKIDPAGRPVLDILCSGNYFCVYEIDDKDPFSRLRITYDGETDEDEIKLATRLNTIKSQFIEAKGLVYNSFELIAMKHRIAHLLSMVFIPSIEIEKCEEQFNKLVQDLKNERKAIITNRILYLLPCFLILVISIIFSFLHYHANELNELLKNISFILTGCLLSLILKANKKRFGELVGAKTLCILLGIERILISLIAGSIFYIAIKAGILIPSMFQDNTTPYTLYLAMIFAGYSETMAPDFLNRITKKNENSNI